MGVLLSATLISKPRSGGRLNPAPTQTHPNRHLERRYLFPSRPVRRLREGDMDLVLGRLSPRPLILLFISCFILSACFSTRADVVTLTPETFTDKVKEKDTVWFVKFCVPWCKHCKNLGTLWEDFGKAVEGEDEIEIGQVDCSVSKPVCSKVDIHSYPTFKIFYDGEEFAKYKGPREVDSLKVFVLDETEKAARMKLEGDRDSS